MTNEVEKIFSGKKLAAIVFKKNIKVTGIKFLTENKNPLQVGIHDRKKGTALSAHMHKITKPINIKSIQEILFVIKGKISVTIYKKNGKKITNKVLKSGDSILLISEGHGVSFLKKSRIFEVKQGPYPGPKLAKEYFQEVGK